MIHDIRFDATVERLRALIGTGGLAPRTAEQASNLVARLETPVRIALLGPEGRGRAEAVAALLGAPVLPDLPDRPAAEIRWGETPRTEVRRVDGTRRPERDVARAFDDPDATLVTLERPLPALRRMSLLDLGADARPDDLRGALAWAETRADVLVWWSADFSAAEREAWEAAPAHLRDHGFLVLWRAVAGPVGAPRAAAQGGGAFVRVLTAGPAEAGGGDGVRALAAELWRHVEFGRQADADTALMFLRKHEGAARRGPPDPFAAPLAGAAPRAGAPIPAMAPGSGLPRAPARRDAPPAPSPARAAAPSPAPSLAHAPEGASGTPGSGSRSPALRAFCREAAAHVRLRARQLLSARGAAPRPASVPPIARHCSQTIAALVERLDDAAGIDDADLDALSALLTDAEEGLARLAEEVAPEEDAVLILLQLRREFEARAAT